MIAYRKRGSDLPGLITYLLGPGRANEHENPRVVAAAEMVDVRMSEELTREERIDLSDQVDWPSRVHGADVRDDHVYHLSLAAAPGDRAISDAEWSEIAHRVMREMGVDDPALAPARWVAIHHGVNDAEAQHVHVALNLVRDDGSHVGLWQDLVKLSHSVKQIEQDYGLTKIEARWKGTGVPAEVRGEMERAQREGWPETDRRYLERAVRAAAAVSSDEAEFVRRVSAEDVLIRPRLSEDGLAVVGYSVAVDRAGSDAAPIWYSGSRLKRDLGLPALRAHWQSSATDEEMDAWRSFGVSPRSTERREGASAAATLVREASAQPRHSTPRRPSRPSRRDGGEPERKSEPRPEERRFSSKEWGRAGEQVRDAVRHLATADPADEATWAYAAREAAGALSAWAERVEATPGPLARAAEQLARSAQTEKGSHLSRPDESPLRSLRGVAMVMAQASMRSDSVAAWAMLTVQFLELSERLEAAHRARGELLRAEQLAEGATAELRSLAEEWSNAGDLRDVVADDLAPEVEESQPVERTDRRRPNPTQEEIRARREQRGDGGRDGR